MSLSFSNHPFFSRRVSAAVAGEFLTASPLLQRYDALHILGDVFPDSGADTP